ncbi:hypothetical protein [uncultured Brevundimonas sp.]|uniref:hypothetical protein n=1 Tax=uncultured Brevundimonas sp. TaxID=213418 RepID=UPI0025DB3622|nr:hypothetical protein [uncultured Brevundimonas sp.]
MSSAKPKRPFGLGAYLAALGLTAVIALVSMTIAAVLENVFGIQGFWANAALLLVAMSCAMVLCVWWWRGIDEAAREAHKWAWWWGGTGGTFVGVAVITSLQLGDATSANLMDFSAGDLVAGSMLAILLFQLVGYGIAWAAWWLRHR